MVNLNTQKAALTVQMPDMHIKQLVCVIKKLKMVSITIIMHYHFYFFLILISYSNYSKSFQSSLDVLVIFIIML